MATAIPWEVLMPLTKYEGWSYSTHFLKSRSSIIRNNFLEYRTKKATLFFRRNDFYALFATNKAKHILNRHLPCSCSDTIYSKNKRKNRKKSHFWKFTISLLGQLPIYDIVWICGPNSPLFQRCQIYDKPPFSSKKKYMTDPVFIIDIWMVRFSDIPVWKYSYFCSNIQLRNHL